MIMMGMVAYWIRDTRGLDGFTENSFPGLWQSIRRIRIDEIASDFFFELMFLQGIAG